MRSIDTNKLDRKSGGSREPALSDLSRRAAEVERGPAVRPSRTQLRKGVTCTPSPIRSLIWTALNPDRT